MRDPVENRQQTSGRMPGDEPDDMPVDDVPVDDVTGKRVLKFYLFGPPRLQWNEQELEISLRKRLALLIYLSVTRRAYTRDALATLFWPEGDQRSARANLRRLLHDLSQILPVPLIETTGDLVRLHPALSIWLDVEHFTTALKKHLTPTEHSPTGFALSNSSEETESEETETVLAQAAALYTDDFLAGFTLADCPEFDDWQFFQREELRRKYATLLHQLTSIHEAQNRLEDAIHYARRRLSLDPLEESAHRHLMTLYARPGQRGAALRQYEECVQILKAELDAAPEAQTSELHEAIRTKRFPAVEPSREPSPVESSPVEPSQRAPAFDSPTAHSTAHSRTALPAARKLPGHTTPFVGRKHEMREVIDRLADPDCRILTLVGPGGVGKTRLATQVAAQMANLFPHGIYFVDLQPLHSADFLVSAIGDAMGLPLTGQTDPLAHLLDQLAGRTLLLLLDNFEQLLPEGGAEILARILQAAAQVKLLVTSREVLHLQEEWLYAVQGLTLPEQTEQIEAHAPGGYDAVQLFIARARQVRHDFSPDEQETDLLTICRLVEGTPLALELAASWVKTLTCAEIAAEIQRNLDFLATNLRNVPDRHRSMPAVFAHSWNLLTPKEQNVFQKLAVFRGGFRREAAEQIAGASLSVLTALVDKSLLGWDATGRYRIHELVRHYAELQLAQSPEAIHQTQQKHAEYYTTFLHTRLDNLLGSSQRQTTLEIEADLENIRVAWRWATQHRLAKSILLATESLSLFYQFQSRYIEGARAFEQAAQVFDTQDPAVRSCLSLVLIEQGWFYIRLGKLEEAQQVMQQAHALVRALNQPPARGHSTDPLLGLGVLAAMRGEYQAAFKLTEQARVTSEAQNHLWNQQTANYFLAGIALAQGKYTAARQYAETAYALTQKTQDRWYMAYCLNELGHVAYALEDDHAARQYYRASYALREELNDPEGMALALNNLGRVALHQKNHREASALYSRSIAMYQQIGDRGGLAAAHSGLANAAAGGGDHAGAQHHFRQALSLVTDLHFTPLALATLAGIGDWLTQIGQAENGLRLLAIAHAHQASDQNTKGWTARRLAYYRTNPALESFIATDTTGSAGSADNADNADSTNPDESSLDALIQVARLELARPLDALLVRQSTPTPDSPVVNAQASAPPRVEPLIEPLTSRESEILQLIADGLTNKEIAARLYLSTGTVKWYTSQIFGKLGARNRTQAVTQAKALHLLA